MIKVYKQLNSSLALQQFLLFKIYSLSSTCSLLDDFCPTSVVLGMGRWFRVTRTGALPRALSRHLGNPPPRLLHVVKHDIIAFLHPPPLSLPLGVDPEHLSIALVPFLFHLESISHGGSTRAAVLATVYVGTGAAKPPDHRMILEELAEDYSLSNFKCPHAFKH